MSATTYDTHHSVLRLQEAGISTAHAEAIVTEVQEAGNTGHNDLATRGELYKSLWILGSCLVGVMITLHGFSITMLHFLISN